MTLQSKIVSGLILIGILASFVGGCQFGKTRVKCQEITSDTISIPDTNWYNIKDSLILSNKELKHALDYWKSHRDTVTLPGDSIPYLADVDTAAILKDYFRAYKYGWEKEDSNIIIKDSVYVTQNVPYRHDLNYKFKKDFVTIINKVDNSVWYSRYIYGGIDIPLKNFNYIEIEAIFAFPKGYVGIGYEPQVGGITAKAGVKLLQFKNKK